MFVVVACWTSGALLFLILSMTFCRQSHYLINIMYFIFGRRVIMAYLFLNKNNTVVDRSSSTRNVNKTVRRRPVSTPSTRPLEQITVRRTSRLGESEFGSIRSFIFCLPPGVVTTLLNRPLLFSSGN